MGTGRTFTVEHAFTQVALSGESATTSGLSISKALIASWRNTPKKRQILELVCLNFRLEDVSLVAEMNKPFDMLAEGLFVSSSRGDKI